LATVPVTDWQYRWSQTGEWAPVGPASHPPPGDGDLFLRARLPPFEARDPALALDGVIGHFELLVDGLRVYAYPPEGLDAKGLAGLPWHLISLPHGAREVTLQVRTSYRLAGVQGVPRLGERAALLEEVVRTDTPRLVVGVLMMLLGVLGLLLFPLRPGRSFGVFAFSGGVYVCFYTHLKQLVLPLTPGLWFFMWLVAHALLPAGFLAFLGDVLREPPRAVRLMRRVHTWYGAAFVAVSALAWVGLSLWGRAAERIAAPWLFGAGSVLRLLIIVTGVVTFTHVIRLVRSGPDRTTARLLVGGLVVLAGALLLNVGAALGLLPTMRGAFVTPGLLAFVVVLAVIGQRTWTRTRLELADRVKEKETMLRDLHDGIGGVTTNIRLLAELGKQDSQRAMEALAAIAELSTEGLAELRAFTQTLDEGEARVTWSVLVSELRRFGGQLIESHGMTFALEARLEDSRAPASALCLTVLRILREALTNVVKHASATRVDVSIAVTPTQLSVSVCDDGAGGGGGGGLDTGRGVANMKARATELGGELSVVTGAGTRLSLTLPLPRN
jgi:signal transduction histidine kinase